MSNFVTIYCPPSDSGILSECGQTQVLSWTDPSVNYIQYYISGNNKSLIKFNFSGITNSSSEIVVRLLYYVDNVYTEVQSWDFGVLNSNTSVYTYLDFGSSTTVNNYITLQIETTNGTSGTMSINLDCDVNVISKGFCTGSTSYDEACTCDDDPITGNTITLYQDGTGGQWDFVTGVWFTDANLQNEAPCGYYGTKGGDGFSRWAVYYYDCALSLPSLFAFCSDSGCPDIECSGVTSLYQHISPSTYKYTNPLVEYSYINDGGPNQQSRTNIDEVNEENAYFFQLSAFSKHCVVIEFPQLTNAAYPIRIGYTGTSIQSDKFITFEDAAFYRSSESPGNIGYSLDPPSQSPFFLPQVLNGTLKYKDIVNNTVWVIPPRSGLVLVKFFIREKNNLATTEITPKCNEGVPIYGYQAGLHVYSAYDSIISPRLTTYVYSLTPKESWVKDQTIIFNDAFLRNPAFPYWYSIDNKTYKVGYPFRRDWGTIHEYSVEKKWFTKKVGMRTTSTPYQNQETTNLLDFTRRLPSCLHMFNTMGTIKEIVNQSNVIEPTKYKYYLGLYPYNIINPGGTETNKVLSNDLYFKLIDVQNTVKEQNSNGCFSVTGFEYAIDKFGESYTLSMPTYLSNYLGALDRYQRLSDNMVSSVVGRSNLYYGLGAAVLAILAIGYYRFRDGGIWWANASINYDNQKQWINQGRFCPKVDASWTINLGLSVLRNFAKIIAIAKAYLPLFIALALAAVLLALVQWSLPISKKIASCCTQFYVVNGYNPYIQIGDSLYYDTNMTSFVTGQFACDGAYFYNISGSTVSAKEVSYTKRAGQKYYSILPDSPSTLITNILQLYLLPFVSGKPDGYTTNPTYSSSEISGVTFVSQDIIGALNNPLPNEFVLEPGFVTSEISQQDADDQAALFFSSVTADTQTILGGFTYKPETISILTNFSHEIKIEETPRVVGIFTDNTDLSGFTIGKTVYVDPSGTSPCLTGYYSYSSQTNYREFLLVLSGTVQDIYTMATSASTTVTSSLTGGTKNIVQTNLDFTSGWYSKNNQPILNPYFEGKWGSSQFYDSTSVKRGFINTPFSANTFYTYTANTGLASGYTEADVDYYREILTDAENFSYVQSQTLLINKVQVCTLTGSGIDFQIVTTSGTPINSLYGISFTAAIYTASTFDSSYNISIQNNESSKLLALAESYNGQITDVVITGYTSTNPINKTLFSGGTFTPCVRPTSTPTQTPSVTPTITPTTSITPTNTQTVSPTNTMTPTPTTPTICYYYDVTIGQSDLDNAVGNTGGIFNNTVYIDYIDCDGNSQTVYRAVSGTSIDDLCVLSTNSPNLYIYINNSQSPVGDSNATNTFVECNVPPSTPTSTPTNEATPTITPTNTATPTMTTTITVTPTVSTTLPVTPTSTLTPTVSVTPSSSITPTNTVTPTRTATPVVSVTPTNTVTPSITPTNTVTPSVSVTPTNTVTPSITPTRTATPAVTPTNTVTPSVSVTPSNTVTPSITPTRTVTPSVTVTPSITATPSITPTRTVTPVVSVTPTNTITPTPSITATLTPTVTPAGLQIQLSTPQSDECTACRLTSYSTVGYVAPTDTTPSVNDVVYTNSTLTNVFNGASQWFKTSWSPNATQYSIQISASGVVLAIKDCSTCPSLTPTPTVTATPTVTPSITASPSVTPSLTPTTTPAGASIQLSTPQNDNCVACRLTTYSQTRYVNPTDTTPNTGDIVYQDSTLTTVFNGNSQWFKTTWGSPTEYSIQIATNGQVLNVTNCSTCPTQTPTPTVTLTQTPTTPEASYTPTPTVTETPTLTPSETSTIIYNYEYGVTRCSNGTTTTVISATQVSRFSIYKSAPDGSQSECYTINTNASLTTDPPNITFYSQVIDCTDGDCIQ